MKEDAEWLRQDPDQEQEWLRQNNLIYGGLIALGVYMVQPFLTAASLDLSAKICVIAFSVAIPLLAALVIVNRQEAFRRRATTSLVVNIAKSVAQTCAFVGVVAGFWHILWIAGVGMLASGLVAVAVHSAGYWRLERDQAPIAPGSRRTRRHRVVVPSTASVPLRVAAPGQPTAKRSHLSASPTNSS